MKTYTLTYSDRYCRIQCNGTYRFQATSYEEARKIAVQWLRDNGGIEGLIFDVR